MVWIVFCVISLLGGGESVQDEAKEKLKNQKVSLQFQETPLLEVIDTFRDLTDQNIFVDPLVSSRGDFSVSLSLKSVSARSALSLLVQSVGIAWVWKEGVIFITTKEKAYREVKLQIYDVRDLLYPIQDFPGIDLQLNGSSLGVTFSDDDPADPEVLPLEEILETHTGGKSWADNPKVSLSVTNGLLVVRQSKKVHGEIQQLLSKLRRNR